MWNEVVLIGNVGRDPEIRSTQHGDKVANFSIATSERWRQAGEAKERTEWHKVVVWGKLAEVIESYVQRGTTLALRGAVRTRKWTDKEGAEKYITEIVLQGFEAKVQILKGGRGQGEGGYAASEEQPKGGKRPPKTPSPDQETDDFDDEIPF